MYTHRGLILKKKIGVLLKKGEAAGPVSDTSNTGEFPLKYTDISVQLWKMNYYIWKNF